MKTEHCLFPLPELQSRNLPMTSMPRQSHHLPNPKRDSQPSNSNTPPKLTSASDKGKIAHFATKVKEKYKRNDPNSSLRILERKGYEDQNNFLKAIYKIFTAYNHTSSISIKPPVSAKKFRMSRYSKVSSQCWII